MRLSNYRRPFSDPFAAPHEFDADNRPTPRNTKATLDAIAYASPFVQTAAPERERLWPDIGWRSHLIVALVLTCAVVLAFGNSVTSLVSYNDTYRDVGYTLDNKYIIQADPRTKAVSWYDPTGKPTPDQVGSINIWTKDYWWPKGISGLYRPIISWTYWFNWHVIGGDESKIDSTLPADQREKIADQMRHRRFLWFHIVNFVAHLMTTGLVYCVGLLMIKRFWPAVAMAVLFSVHPVTVESVTNIIGRADIFASIAGLGGLLLYARASVSRGAWKIPWLVLLFLITSIGLFSKESAITILPILMVYDLIFRRPAWKQRTPVVANEEPMTAAPSIDDAAPEIPALSEPQPLPIDLMAIWHRWVDNLSNTKFRLLEMTGWLIRWTYTGYIAVIIPIIGMLTARYFIFTASSPPEEPFIDNPLRGVNWFFARLSAIQVTVRSWKLCVWPFRLTADYSFNQIPPAFSPWSNPANNWFAIVSLLIVIAVIGLAIWLWTSNRSRAGAFFICFFFITYVLTANLVYTIGAIMAERFLYLPVVGFLGVAVLGLEAAVNWGSLRVKAISDDDRPLLKATALCSIVGVIAIAFGIRTAMRNQDWRSDAALWRAALPVAPNSFRVYQSYAFSLYEEVAKSKENRQPETKDVNIDDVIAVAEKARPIMASLNDRLSSTRLYLHLGMYYDFKGEQLMVRGDKGQIMLPPESVKAYKKAVEALERAVPIDQEFSAGNRQREIQRGKVGGDIADVGLYQIYEYLGNAYLRLNDIDKALGAFQYMRNLDATNSEAYMHIASVYLARRSIDQQRQSRELFGSDTEQAAIALLQSLWLNNSRPELWQVLNDTLASLCAPGSPQPILVENGSPRLNMQQPVVRSIICSSYQSLVRIFLQCKLVAFAENVRASAVRDSHYPQQLFDDIFTDFGRVPPPVNMTPATQPNQPKQSNELR